MTTKRKKDAAETLEQIWGWIQKATWPKVALGVLAILVGFWQLHDGDQKVEEIGTRLTVVEEDLESLDESLEDIGERQADIEAGDQDLNRSIANAVARGIERGVAEVMDEVRALVKRLVEDTG